MLEIFKVGHCWHPEAMVFKNLSLNKMRFPAYVGLIHHPNKGYILFDTGYAKRFLDITNKFPEKFYRLVTPMALNCKESLTHQIKQRNIALSEINYIFISHFHADHISGLLDFPKAQFICSKLAYSEIITRGRIKGLIKGYLKGLIPHNFHKRCTFIEDIKPIKINNQFSPFITGHDLFNDGSLLAISLPGHAKGQYGLMCLDNGDSTFLIGDAAWTKSAISNLITPNPLAYLIMDSKKSYLHTLNQLNQLYTNNSDIKIMPSHCEASFLEYYHAQ